MNTYTKADICIFIDQKIKKEMEYKNAYIQKNGYTHTEILNRFDQRIAAFSELYGLLQ